MIGLLALGAAIVSLVFASIWAARGWGAGPCCAIAIPGGVLVLFVPYAYFLVLVGSLIIIPIAQKAIFHKLANEDDDPYAMGAPGMGYGFHSPAPPPQAMASNDPYAAPVASQGPPICPVCQSAALDWRPDVGRWYCPACTDWR